MPDIYFNPYPGAAKDACSGKQALVATAKAVLAIKQHLEQAYNPCGDIPFREFILYKDRDTGVHQTIPGAIYSLAGRDRELVKRFMLLFDKGRSLTAEELNTCCDWVLKGIEASAPVLEYAARQQAMVATLPTESEWICDFLEFEGREEKLPNIHGQSELAPLHEWIKKWHKRWSDFFVRLETVTVCDLIICPGAMNQHFPSPSEYELTLDIIKRAEERNFEHDGYLVKNVLTLPVGVVKQLKQKGSGVRVFITIFEDSENCLSGFYKKGKGDTRAQNKAIKKAGDRAVNWYNSRV